MIERDRAGDDRPLVQRKAEPVAELQTEGRVLVREAEDSAVGQTFGHLVGGHARLDHGDRGVDPFPRLDIGVVLRGVARPMLKVR
jgi:hypothetical protein